MVIREVLILEIQLSRGIIRENLQLRCAGEQMRVEMDQKMIALVVCS